MSFESIRRLTAIGLVLRLGRASIRLSTPETRITAEIARERVQSVAPQELPMFRTNSAAYFADPESALEQRKGKDDMLGFGLAEAAGFLTPVGLAAVSTIIQWAIREFSTEIREQGESAIAAWVRVLFRIEGSSRRRLRFSYEPCNELLGTRHFHVCSDRAAGC